jgi:prepilin-type N-terminal cleavage/methylation domain-containing protein
MRKRSSQRAFTLVEMMAVVAIVGVLSIVAVVAFRKWVSSSHVGEAQNMLLSIRNQQEAYYQETNRVSYLDISNSMQHADAYPRDPVCGSGNCGSNVVKTAWGAPCGGACLANDWSKLNVQPDGPVIFGYVLRAGGTPSQALKTDPSSAGGVALPEHPNYWNELKNAWADPKAKPVNPPWWVATAFADIDGNGVPVIVSANSLGNEIFVDNQDE